MRWSNNLPSLWNPRRQAFFNYQDTLPATICSVYSTQLQSLVYTVQ
jgi:hypothetical protein